MLFWKVRMKPLPERREPLSGHCQRGAETRERESVQEERGRTHELEMRRIELEATREQGRQENYNTQQHSRATAPKLPVFYQERDELDAYLSRFERYAEAQRWPIEQWCTNLSALLMGKALETYYELHADDAGNYDKLKDTLLKCFLLNADGFRTRFYTRRAEKGEPAAQFMTPLERCLDRWMELSETKPDYENLRCLIIR